MRRLKVTARFFSLMLTMPLSNAARCSLTAPISARLLLGSSGKQAPWASQQASRFRPPFVHGAMLPGSLANTQAPDAPGSVVLYVLYFVSYNGYHTTPRSAPQLR